MKPYYSDDYVQIYHGDCREILPHLEKVDLVLTDPPYGVNKQYENTPDGNHTSSEYWQKMDTFYQLCLLKSSVLLFTPGQVNLIDWIRRHKPYYVCCWYKSNQNSWSKLGGANNWEAILVYGKPYTRPNTDAWNIPIGLQRIEAVGKHIVPKSEKMWSTLVAQFSNQGDLILDPFLGSGTTAYCAKKLNRKCIGIEIEEKYCEIAARRCSQSVMNVG